MGRRGPKPTPTNVLRMRGSWRAKLRAGEPEPPASKPSCPDWLRPEAKTAFRRVVGWLESMSLASKVDTHAIARYCQTWARWRELEEEIEDEGQITSEITERSHREVINPKCRLAKMLAEQLTKLEDRFGLSPSARASLKIEGNADGQGQAQDRFLG